MTNLTQVLDTLKKSFEKDQREWNQETHLINKSLDKDAELIKNDIEYINLKISRAREILGGGKLRMKRNESKQALWQLKKTGQISMNNGKIIIPK